MTAGRPTKYSKDILEKTVEYINSCEDQDEQQLSGLSAKGTEMYKNKIKVNLPSIEGLAYKLKISKNTIYEWCKDNKEFSDVIEDLRSKQARELISKGLSGDYNPTIAKVLLTKHGYREGIDQTTNDKPIGGLTLEQQENIERLLVLKKSANAEMKKDDTTRSL